MVGLVLYISSINDEMLNRTKSNEAYFTYKYGWSFAFAAISFLLTEVSNWPETQTKQLLLWSGHRICQYHLLNLILYKQIKLKKFDWKCTPTSFEYIYSYTIYYKTPLFFVKTKIKSCFLNIDCSSRKLTLAAAGIFVHVQSNAIKATIKINV